MCNSQSSVILTLVCFSCHVLIILATSTPGVAISCGSSSNSTAPDGRLWIGDSGFLSNPSFQIKGKPANSRAIHHLASRDSIPYKTARASRHEFSYVFSVRPGQKFIRLHFYQSLYKGFKRSTPLFSVKVGPYTLLSNFSTSILSDVSGAREIIKEYCVNIDEDQRLNVTFTPAGKTRKADDFYAFVNGIEVVPMPTGLYFTPEGEFGTLVVGNKYRFYIDNSTALELVQRLNVGGTNIAPLEDSGMFRRWDDGTKYLLGMDDMALISPGQKPTPIHIAPAKAHQKARTVNANAESISAGFTWKIPVDLGFRYLIRLHSSEFQTRTEASGNEKFLIVINNQIAGDTRDVMHSDGAFVGAAYRDYITIMEGDKRMGKRCLTIGVRPSFESRDEQFHATLNGLEVFKLSNPDNSLAGIWAVPELQRPKSTLQHKKPLLANSFNLIATILTVILALLNVVVYQLKRVWDPNSRRSVIRASPTDNQCRQFSIDEIRASTNNFDPLFYVGRGGQGRVYKGSINWGDTVVAIKRLKTDSRQEDEFWTEIKMLSKIRHEHLVSLIGYCNDGQERLLVYQYMTRGTLSDHLFKINRHKRSNPPLPWELRLKVVIGAARGLYCLHSRHRIIHRDVKSSNILLDENWVAKIADFGLSTMGPEDSYMHISTNVKGTFGYLDPEYFLTRKLTRKSDVYAFGVVLFEVLSGRPAVDLGLEEERHSLAGWARCSIRERKVEQLIDENIMRQISPACLKVFVGIAGRCLHTKPQGRPAMADVVMALELALGLQQTGETMEQIDDEDNAARSHSDNSDGVIYMDDLCVTPPKGESDRTTSEDASVVVKSGGIDQKKAKMKKTMGSSNNATTRWWWDPFGILTGTASSPKGDSDRTTSEDASVVVRNGGIDQKNAKLKKTMGSSKNASTRWWWVPFGILPGKTSESRASSPLSKGIIHQFSFHEIQKATNNFHNAHIIGFGGPDNVYKGLIDGDRKDVAIRWSRTAESRLSMANELKSKKEIQTKASASQDHMVSLIGYCETESDMILVYDYMTNGTLYYQLHEPNKDPLPWKRRLQICIGVVRGVSCIHSIGMQTMLHRYLNSTNVWLDEKWIPKVSAWGLSRKKGDNQEPTIFGGNWGCMDSDYIRGEKATEKSYVYSLGVILFEVLFADKESDRWFDQEQVSLSQWIKSCMRNNLSGCIDPFLIGRASPASLKIFIETAGRCLNDYGTDRPSISEIKTRLEAALEQQEATEKSQGCSTHKELR